MKDVLVDSSVVAKWILPESDSAQAQDLMTAADAAGVQLVMLDLAYCEVANAIWKRRRQNLITQSESATFLDALLHLPVRVEPALCVLPLAFDIAIKFDRAIYDALFVALSHDLSLPGVTADEPLFNAIHAAFKDVALLRNWRNLIE